MIFWESDLNFVTVLLDAINLGHLLLQKPNGAGDRRVHAATMISKVLGAHRKNRKVSRVLQIAVKQILDATTDIMHRSSSPKILNEHYFATAG